MGARDSLLRHRSALRLRVAEERLGAALRDLPATSSWSRRRSGAFSGPVSPDRTSKTARASVPSSTSARRGAGIARTEPRAPRPRPCRPAPRPRPRRSRRGGPRATRFAPSACTAVGVGTTSVRRRPGLRPRRSDRRAPHCRPVHAPRCLRGGRAPRALRRAGNDGDRGRRVQQRPPRRWNEVRLREAFAARGGACRGAREACSRHDVPLAALALQFPLRHPAVTTILVGARSAEEIEEDVELDTLPIPPALWSEPSSRSAAPLETGWKSLSLLST